MFLKKIFMLMVISKMYPFNFTSHDFKITVAATVMLISGAYSIKHFITTNKEKKLFGKFYKYKGNIKQLIEDYNQAGEDDNTLDNKNIIKKLIKDNPYNIQNFYDWEKNNCGETFLINFIKSVFSVKSTEHIKKYKSFF